MDSVVLLKGGLEFEGYDPGQIVSNTHLTLIGTPKYPSGQDANPFDFILSENLSSISFVSFTEIKAMVVCQMLEILESNLHQGIIYVSWIVMIGWIWIC